MPTPQPQFKPLNLMRHLMLIAIEWGIVFSIFFLMNPSRMSTPTAMAFFFFCVIAIMHSLALASRAAVEKFHEGFIAWRYVRRHKGSWVTLYVGLGFLFASSALVVAVEFIRPEKVLGMDVAPTMVMQGLQYAAIGTARLGWWIVVYGVLIRYFSVFTTISTFGVYLGISSLVAVLSVMGGFENDLRQKIVAARAHITVRKPDAIFDDYRPIVQKLKKEKSVKGVAAFLESEVMVTSQTNLAGVVLRGIRPNEIAAVTDLPRFLRGKHASGTLANLQHPERLGVIPAMPFSLKATSMPASQPSGLNSKRANSQPTSQKLEVASRPSILPIRKKRPIYPGVIIGSELANSLRLYVGDDVNIVSPVGGMSPAGPIPKSRPFRVAGIFYSGMYEYDMKFAYILMSEARRFLGVGDEITGAELKMHNEQDAPSLAARLSKELGNDYEIKDWQQLNRSLFSALKLEKIVMFIVLFFIVIVATFSIVTNLIMMIYEKSREIGALKAIGATNGSLLRVFMFAGLFIGGLGVILGIIEGVGICTYLAHVGMPINAEVYYIAKLPVKMNAFDIALVGVSGVILSFLAAIFPALRAGRLLPVQALRND